MKRTEYFGASRRRFMGLVSGVFSGFFLFGSGPAQTPKTGIRQILDNLSVESLIHSTPRRHPDIWLRPAGEDALLYRSGFAQPIAEINDTGRLIWNRCNGKNTPRDIAAVIARAYPVDAHQAFVDCLLFLAVLKAKTVILL